MESAMIFSAISSPHFNYFLAPVGSTPVDECQYRKSLYFRFRKWKVVTHIKVPILIAMPLNHKDVQEVVSDFGTFRACFSFYVTFACCAVHFFFLCAYGSLS